MIRKVEIERFTLISSKQFDEVVAALNAGIGHPDMADFGRSTREARSLFELKNVVEKGLSTSRADAVYAARSRRHSPQRNWP